MVRAPLYGGRKVEAAGGEASRGREGGREEDYKENGKVRAKEERWGKDRRAT